MRQPLLPHVARPAAPEPTSSPSTVDARRRRSPRTRSDGARLKATLPYVPGLDGLRAIAVLAVLLYHARDLAGLPGVLRPASGFLGVEVFFVISGYLITALLLGEHARSGTLQLLGFWARRARRLLPALYLLLLGTVVLAAVLGDGFATIRNELAGAVLYVSNWLLIAQDTSYFEAAGRPSLLRHLWSLAVEEQFYLLWPLVMFVGLRWLGHRTLFALTVAAAVASTAVAWILFDRLEPYSDVTAIYYRTDARAGGLLIGASAAFVWRPWLHAQSSVTRAAWVTRATSNWRVLDAAGVTALAVVIWAQYAFTDQVVDWDAHRRLYHAGFLFTSIPTIVLIGVVVTPGSRLGRVLGNTVLRWVGTRSYGLYLWHWPVYQLTRPRVDVEIDGWTALALRLVVTIALAELSYRLVETPVRERRFVAALADAVRWTSRRQVLVGAANAGAVLTVAGLALALPATDRGGSTGPDAFVRSAPLDLSTSAPPLRVVEQSTLAPRPTVEGLSASALPPIVAGLTAPPSAAASVNTQPPSVAASVNTRPPSAAAPSVTTPTASVAARPASAPPTTVANWLPEPGAPVAGPPPRITTSDVPASTSAIPGPAAAALATPAPTQTTPPAELVATSDPDLPVDPGPATQLTSPGGSPSFGSATMTVVGDSVVLGASTELVKMGDGVSIYGQVGRQWWQITSELRDLAGAGRLGDVVVIQLGNNGTLTAEIFDEVMATLADAELVLFVNVRVPKSWEADVNAMIAAGVARHAPRARLADWHGVSNEHPEFFLADGVHLQLPGSEALRQLIEGALTG